MGALKKYLFLGYIISILALFFYSYTQIDLGLTITRVSSLQGIQQAFQYIGYFNRPLSTFIFIVIMVVLFMWYIYFLQQASKNTFHKKSFWILVLLTAGMLTFSYTAFSYDIFNYIFDAKIFSFYNQNPYEHRPLDYPTDPMLSFMHWTHRTYPYGPLWLGITIPLSYIGMHIFTVTYFLFKLLATLFFLGSIYFIGKIMQKISPQHEVLAMTFFAFNPLVLAESLVSSHNDMAMMFFALFGVYLLVSRKIFFSALALLASIAVKFATLFLVPILILRELFPKKITWQATLFACSISMFLAVIAASVRTNFQPWYLLYFLSFAALLSYQRSMRIPSIVLSAVALCNYIPFLYTGNWDPPIPQVLLYFNAASMAIAFVIGIIFHMSEKRAPKS